MPGMKLQPDPPLPKQVQIEPVGQCNLQCRMCLIRGRKQNGPAFMDRVLYRDLLSQFNGSEELHLQGLGEPFLHPSIFDMVSHAAGRGLSVSTNTNLTILSPGQAEACVRSGLNWMRVSLDGATPETYEAIRTGSRLQKVLRNLEMLSGAKQRAGSEFPRIYLVMVLMRTNLDELPEVIRLAHRYSINQVFVQNLCTGIFPETGAHDQRLEDFFQKESLVGEGPERVTSVFREASNLAQDLQIVLRLPRLASHAGIRHMRGRERCDWPWRAAYITYDGTAVPCCMIGLPERTNIGSMAQKGVRAIWNGEAYRRFRSQLDSDDPPPVCRSCSLYRGTF